MNVFVSGEVAAYIYSQSKYISYKYYNFCYTIGNKIE